MINNTAQKLQWENDMLVLPNGNYLWIEDGELREGPSRKAYRTLIGKYHLEFVRIFFSKLSQSCLKVPQDESSGVSAIFGTWPGDETDDEITEVLK